MDIRNMSLMDLAIELAHEDRQEIKNLLALELTYRMYVPFEDKTFEEMLVENGYKIIEKTPDKKIK